MDEVTPNDELTSAFREVVDDVVQEDTVSDPSLFVLKDGRFIPVDRIRVRYGEDNGGGPTMPVPPGVSLSFRHGVLTFVLGEDAP
ncbi:MAG: hypothetical protein M3O91_01475 [Chloroflexota bacterium]|nr:hypothetical protein [Chloroflexota bacterium]